MTVKERSAKCLARVPRRGAKPGEVKFCGKPTTYNDLCRRHDRKFVAGQTFNKEL
jgi:hypothetical protein